MSKYILLILLSIGNVYANNMEIQLYNDINSYRVSHGLSKLVLNTNISNIAHTHSQQIASGVIPIGHSGFNNRIKLISKTMSYRGVSENVAYNTSNNPINTAIDGWLNSSHHYANIMGNYNITGIGIAQSETGAYIFTQIFWLK